MATSLFLRRPGTILLAALLVSGLSLVSGCEQSAAPTKPAAPTQAAAPSAAQPTGKPAQSPAPTPAAVFPAPGKNIELIVPTAAGTGFDLIARIMAPALQAQLPNKPNIVVQNKPGGDWAIGNTAVATAKPDGYTIGMFNLPGNTMNQIKGMLKFDLTELTWLGGLKSDPYLVATSAKSGLKTIADLQKRPEVKVGVSGGVASSQALAAVLTAASLKFKAKLIPHAGFPESATASMRGDVDMLIYPFATVQSMVANGDLVPIFMVTHEKYAAFPQAKTADEVGAGDLADTATLTRGMAAPKNLPAPVVQVLRSAMASTFADPGFRAKMQESKQIVDPLTPEQMSHVAKASLRLIAANKGLLGGK